MLWVLRHLHIPNALRAVALQCPKGHQPEAPHGMKRSVMDQGMEGWPSGCPVLAPPGGGCSKGQSPPSPAQQPPSLIPFSAGISLCSVLGFLAISNSSHLCIQDSKDCNEGNQHVNRDRGVHHRGASSSLGQGRS